jgi:branched-subunit amino acid transport protein AzlD
MDQLMSMLPLLLPIIILELVLIVVCLRDLVKRKEVLGGNKVVWALVIIFVQIIGAALYLFIGRKESPVDGD